MAITGQLVKSLYGGDRQPTGEHRLIWDGTDGNGKTVSTGIYFYELYVDNYKESKAMILVK
jgi:flagellar hook assembly protein FlgD